MGRNGWGDPLKLHWSPRSPFVRKVMIALHEKGMLDRVETVRSTVTMAAPPNPDVLADNPLGKIPTLIRDDGVALFDSGVICEYIDGLGSGARLIPQAFEDRIACLRWQALGDGLSDILVLWRNEVSRGGGHSAVMSDAFADKTRATLARLDAEAPDLAVCEFGLGQAAIVCALGQLDFRYSDCGWRGAFPALAGWYRDVQARPSVAATEIVDDGGTVMGEVAMPLTFDGRAA